MNRRHNCAAFSLLAMLVLLVGVGAHQDAPQQADEKDFTPLVRGTDPEQFELVGFGSDTITISDDGEVSLSGKPNGYFATKEAYENYTLRFEWKYDRPSDLNDDATFDGNSGVLLHIREPHKAWPACIEAQLMNSDAGHLFGIAGGKFNSKRSDSERREGQKAIKPVGEWNQMEIVSRDGTIRCSINGALIDEGDGAQPAEGPIGWQSEGRPIRFRNLRIRKM